MCACFVYLNFKNAKTGKGIILSWEMIQMGTRGKAVINIENVLDFIFLFEFIAKRGKRIFHQDITLQELSFAKFQ